MSTTVEINKRPVHPVADLFPMMTDEELADLAADIKANGLIHPIVIDQKGLLIDGRNRARACEIAGFEPTVRMFEGDDPRAFILSMNLKRRHMSAGQQAMAHAMIYPEPEKGGRGKKSKNSTETLGFSAMRLSQARTVLSHSRDVAMEISVLNRYRAYVLRIQYGQPYMSFVPVRRSHASHLAVSFGVTSTISPSSSSSGSS